jgi:hypothetical protein
MKFRCYKHLTGDEPPCAGFVDGRFAWTWRTVLAMVCVAAAIALVAWAMVG